MRNWIHNLKENQSAFDNSDLSIGPIKLSMGKLLKMFGKLGINILVNLGTGSYNAFIQEMTN